MSIADMVEFLIGGIFIAIFFVYSGKVLLHTKFQNELKNILIVLILILFVVINYLFLDNVVKMMTLYIVVLFVYKLIFKKNVTQCAIASLIAYLILALGEIAFVIALSILRELNLISNMAIFTGSALANYCICLFSLLLLQPIKRICAKAISKVKENNKFILIFTFSIVLTAICSVFYKMQILNWKYDDMLFLNIVLIISMIYIGVVIIKQHLEKSKISDDYEKYLEYSKQNETLVEQYSMSQHENKNELIIIRSMVHKSNTKLLEYLDEIIQAKDNIKDAWIRYLRYIPFGGLKGIFHNKVSVMKEEGINVFLSISKDVTKSCLKDLNMKENNQLSKIIGVFLDNAREASLSSSEKEVSVCVYMEDEVVVFEISNTYSNIVDIEKMYVSGFSSKGKKRGYGLALVKTLVDEASIFENITDVKDEYFVQILKVKK